MKFKIIAVGKIKENYYREAVAEYVKRLSRFASVEITEVPECYFNGEPNGKEIEKIISVEGQGILQKAEGFTVAMDIAGRETSSEELSQLIVSNKMTNSVFSFIIGGSYGLSDEVKKKAHARCSFGKITLPHQLFRVVLCEQIYRACCIENNVAYHK
ncbi:MAG: 23S rRNA (pseudouridine(1915)-N(3))-methyltransferase RlmH [Corallococcus sp.]|nr:23S rRNA (pseudouridine(1915)-N(3))-methyltransferase RlmH [Corallococcus sp.]